MNVAVVVGVSLAYLAILFGIAYFGDRRSDRGKSVIANGWIYALSLGVYATTWTYYGSVGRAAESGIGFLPIYLGPAIMAVLWVVVLRKIIRICREQRITSLADFVSARYGKTALLGQLVTIVAVVGVVPYIALQLKAVSTTFTLLRSDSATASATPSVLGDTALWIALLLAGFTIVFGTRHLDATERHEGMVAAIAVESVIKLVAFLAVGIYITYIMFNGLGDLFGQVQSMPEFSQLLQFGESQSYLDWTWMLILSALAVLLLPRQWQVGVIENVDETHLRTASWLFPTYLLVINLFVLPITVAGVLTFAGTDVPADNYVLALPLAEGAEALALLVFIGGLSAATGMIVVETIALATMVSNSLVLPALLRNRRTLQGDRDVTGLIIAIRRVTIIAVLLLGFAYARLAADALSLVSIGLVSFAAVAQFAPAVLGGLYWKGANARGALWGMVAGFAVWAYTLPLPSLSATGLVPESFVTDGPWGISWLTPHALFGVAVADPVSHSMMWSMLVNIGLFIGLSITGSRSANEHVQASAFVDVFTRTQAFAWRGSVSVAELQRLLARFVGPEPARLALDDYAASTNKSLRVDAAATADLVRHVETTLAGTVGAVSARVIVSSATHEEDLSFGEVMQVLDETSQVLATSRALEAKSIELEQATNELQAANLRLRELDQLKDDFISSVTHELRTPLTSIQAFSEILLENPGLPETQQTEYLSLVVAETQRLGRLINQVLDLSKLESEAADWNLEPIEVSSVVQRAVNSISPVAAERNVALQFDSQSKQFVEADADKLLQVVLNIVGNAVKFSPSPGGEVTVQVSDLSDSVQVDVTDNGPGIDERDHDAIFDKFHQVNAEHSRTVAGTGLGLPISRQIIEELGGMLWVASAPGAGSTFSFRLPRVDQANNGAAASTVIDPLKGKES